MAFATSIPRSTSVTGPGAGQAALGLLLGAGFTLALFLGIARFDRAAPVEPPDDILDLRAVSLQEPPPPPREIPPHEPVPIEDTLTGLEQTPSESPVQIAVTPPDLESLLPPPQVAPPAVIQVGQLYTNLKPKMELTNINQQVFQMSDVDQLPQVLFRVMPRIPPAQTALIKTPRVTLLFVVDAKGEIGNVRVIGSCGNPEVDEIVRKVLLEWTFAPAIRKGVKVRCLFQQAMILKLSNKSVFEL